MEYSIFISRWKIGFHIPTYLVACFLLPKFFYDELENVIGKFGGRMGKKGIHWSGWNNLCDPKELGMMRFRKLSSFNTALLAK